ncbi:MAG TPA: helix-turn-helix domain-containing protein [Ktedonobacteraceae bacterium]|nr:helix-turn-helix domain-containing protein [Ktedonobacteraceae bacterium]
MGKRTQIHLTEDERGCVRDFLRQGKAHARNLKRAEALLKSDEGWDDAHIAEALAITEQTVRNIRKRFYSGGIEAVLADKQQQSRRRRKSLLSDEQAAQLLALTESAAPGGRDHWSIRMLADKAVELGYVEHLSRETVRVLLKKHMQQNTESTA